MARKDSNWKHILFIVLMYAVTVPALYAYLAWNKVDTPFAYEFLQRLGIAGVENLSDAGVRDLWFFEMSQFYGVATGISLLMVVIWNVIFWKAGAPGRRSLENILFAVFIALHILMTLLVAIISGIFGFANYVNPTGDMSDLIKALIGTGIGMLFCFIVQWITYDFEAEKKL